MGETVGSVGLSCVMVGLQEAVGGSSEAERSVFHTQYRLGPLEDFPHPQTAESGGRCGRARGGETEVRGKRKRKVD